MPIPEKYSTVTPFLILKDVPEFIEFAKKAFLAQEIERYFASDGISITHAEIKIGDSIIMLSEVSITSQPTNGMFYIYTEDVDEMFKRAVEAGGKSFREPELQFYGDKVGGLQDKFGNFWWIATDVEDISNEELMKRSKEASKKKKNN